MAQEHAPGDNYHYRLSSKGLGRGWENSASQHPLSFFSASFKLLFSIL